MPLTCSLGTVATFTAYERQDLSCLLPKKTLSSFYLLCIYKIRVLTEATEQ